MEWQLSFWMNSIQSKYFKADLEGSNAVDMEN